MAIGTMLILTFICAVCRAIMFYRRDLKVWHAFIPGLNKYELGKTVGCKKIAIANGIAHVFVWVYFVVCLGYEVWIMQNYAYAIAVPTNESAFSQVYVDVPVSVANIATWSKYGLIAIALVTLILWCMMMWRFTMAHKKNPWWIILWACIPVIPYIYFTAISDFVSKDGKRYTVQKVEIKE